jgi:hypothetical protein
MLRAAPVLRIVQLRRRCTHRRPHQGPSSPARHRLEGVVSTERLIYIAIGCAVLLIVVVLISVILWGPAQ